MRHCRSLSYTLDTPLGLAQRASVVLLHPQGHAAEVEAVVALAPDDHALLGFGVGLAPETGFHQLDTTNCASVALNVPGPGGHQIPLLQCEIGRAHV